MEASREAELRVPGACNHLGRQALVAGGDAGTDVGSVAIGPCGFDELCSDVTVAGVGDVAAMFVMPAALRRDFRVAASSSVAREMALGRQRRHWA